MLALVPDQVQSVWEGDALLPLFPALCRAASLERENSR